MAVRTRQFAGLIAASTALAGTADAHTPFPGFEGVFSGLLHPLIEPGQGMLALSAALLIGRQGRGAFALGWAIWSVAVAAGALAGLIWALTVGGNVPTGVLAGTVLILGASAALSAQTGSATLIALAGLAGMIAGLNAVPEPGAWAAMALTGLGAAAGAVVLTGYAGAGAVWLSLRTGKAGEFASVGMRVAASWLAAAAALVTAFALRAG